MRCFKDYLRLANTIDPTNTTKNPVIPSNTTKKGTLNTMLRNAAIISN